MKTIVIIIITGALLWSCDNRKDPYAGIDPPPILTIQKLTDTIARTSLSDSMILGKPYIFKYNIVSFENLSLNIVKSPDSDSVVVSNNLVYVSRTNEGISTYILNTMDPFGKSAKATVQITYFNDIPPVCEFTVTLVGQLSPYEIDINCSVSYSPAVRWKEQIKMYEYRIENDYDVQTELNEIHYICDGPGQKKISVRCSDTNGTWSQWVNEYFMLTVN